MPRRHQLGADLGVEDGLQHLSGAVAEVGGSALVLGVRDDQRMTCWMRVFGMPVFTA